MVIATSSSPGGNFFSGIAAQLAISYYSVSVGLTAMLTWAICYRMVMHGLEMKKHLGRDYASVYFAVFSLVIESVLPFSLAGIAFVVSLGVGSATSIAFGCVYVLLMVSRSMCGSVTRANGFAVYITADADPAGGIWTRMDRGDRQGTAVNAPVQDAWEYECVDGVARFRGQRCNGAWRRIEILIEKALWLGNTSAEIVIYTLSGYMLRQLDWELDDFRSCLLSSCRMSGI
jgi:hypothetical protein